MSFCPLPWKGLFPATPWNKFGLDAENAVGQSEANGIVVGFPWLRYPKAIPGTKENNQRQRFNFDNDF
jgi:hypothetical protein